MLKMLPLIALFFLLSCQPKKEQPQPAQPPVPEALQENKKSDSYSKRGAEDLVEELYLEQLNKSPELQRLEKNIKELRDYTPDSLHTFVQFNLKNEAYYNNASGYINRIQDSLLKKETTALLANAAERYRSRISGLNAMLTTIDTKNLSVVDRHTIAKLLISLGMMDRFQKDNLPSAKPIEAILKKQDRIINTLDSVINKNK